VSLRARAESWLRTFDAMDTIDLVTRLGLVAILVSDHVAGYEWYLKAPTRGLAIAGLLVPTLARRSSFWGVLTFAFTLRTLTDWWFQDNHLFVFTYWCLTLALALRLAQPLPALATSARLLVGLSFALATQTAQPYRLAVARGPDADPWREIGTRSFRRTTMTSGAPGRPTTVRPVPTG
jgi:hypothetical protein